MYIYLDGLMFQRRTGEHTLNNLNALRALNTVGSDSIGTGNLLPDSVIARWLSLRTTDFIPPNITNWHRLITVAGVQWKAGNQLHIEGAIQCESANSAQVALRLVTTTFGTSAATVFNLDMLAGYRGVARFSFKIPVTFTMSTPESWHLEAIFGTVSLTVKPDNQTYLLVQEEKR
jgi:hypothetical protein